MKITLKSLLIVMSLIVLPKLMAQTYTLVWEDNFDGASLDSSIWNIEEKEGIWNTGSNSELQHYKRENVTIEDDGSGNNCLVLTAKEESYNGYNYTSGKVTTKGKLAFRRGKLEASIKIPDLANGLWPAFWTLGYTSNGWPDCGEIDVMEMGHAAAITANEQNTYMGAHLFWGPYPSDYGTEYTATEDLSTGYYKHTLVWTETTISVYFNDAETPYFSMGITGDDLEEFRDYQDYIIFNMAVGGLFTGITDNAGITASLPASMYVDWVKVYQEVGSEDYNDSSLAIFGDYGVYEETVATTISMTQDFDLFANTTGLTDRAGETPYEGNELLSYNVSSGQAYEIKLSSGLLRNMSNYNEGSMQLQIKTNITDAILIGIGDTAGYAKLSTFSSSTIENFDRDGSWQLVYISLTDFTDVVSLSELLDLLIIKGTSSTDGYISIDQVFYKETLPDEAYYGIYWDTDAIVNGFEVNNSTTNMFIWDNTVTFNDVFPAYEGENVLSFRSSGAETWFGFGFISSSPVNLQAFSLGYLNISMRTSSTESFYIAMDAHDDSEGKIDFISGSDPYGFIRDGEWQHLKIPLSHFTAQGLNLSSIQHVFMTGGGGSIGDIAYDYIYLSEDYTPIINMDVCYAANIDVTPKNSTILVDESLSYSAEVTNQFDMSFDNRVEWSVDGGNMGTNGIFSSNIAGVYNIVASQANASGTTTVTVTEASAVSDTEEQSLFSYFNKNNNELIIEGINSQSEIFIISTSGKLVYYKQDIRSETHINLSNQPAGIYMVRVVSGDNSYVNKFVK